MHQSLKEDVNHRLQRRQQYKKINEANESDKLEIKFTSKKDISSDKQKQSMDLEPINHVNRRITRNMFAKKIRISKDSIIPSVKSSGLKRDREIKANIDAVEIPASSKKHKTMQQDLKIIEIEQKVKSESKRLKLIIASKIKELKLLDKFKAKDRDKESNSSILRISKEREQRREITLDVRKNMGKIVPLLEKFSDLGYLPKEQIQTLKEMVKSHRIFISSQVDHDAARNEFNRRRMSLIREYEKQYNIKWPVNPFNKYLRHPRENNEKLFVREGRPVSAHHIIPVGCILIPNQTHQSEVDKILGIGPNNKDELLDAPKVPIINYSVNSIWNIMPSSSPEKHNEGIHAKGSKWSTTFHEIPFHYKQIDEEGKRWISVIPDEKLPRQLPEFVVAFPQNFALLEKQAGVSMHPIQKLRLLETLQTYAQQFPESNYITKLDSDNVRGHLREFYFDKSNIQNLIKQWEKTTNTSWPSDRRDHVEFVINVFHKANTIAWFNIFPGAKSESIQHHIPDFRKTQFNKAG